MSTTWREPEGTMDLPYLTGQRPPDVLVMRRDDIEDKAPVLAGRISQFQFRDIRPKIPKGVPQGRFSMPQKRKKP